ncbi:MAG TPA: hypothetical protein PKW95_20575 [bacterium]|nr:hypothetical protein [bacterium]
MSDFPTNILIENHVARALARFTDVFRNQPRLKTLVTSNPVSNTMVNLLLYPPTGADSVYKIVLDGTEFTLSGADYLNWEYPDNVNAIGEDLALLIRDQSDLGIWSNFSSSIIYDGEMTVFVLTLVTETYNSPSPQPFSIEVSGPISYGLSSVDQIQELEYMLADMYLKRTLADAKGLHLDNLGETLGYRRPRGQNDDEYRGDLAIWHNYMQSSGEPERLIHLVREFANETDDVMTTTPDYLPSWLEDQSLQWAEDLDVELKEYFPGFVIITTNKLPVNATRLGNIIEQASPAGVHVDVVVADKDNAFCFDSISLPSGFHGFDSSANPGDGGRLADLL